MTWVDVFQVFGGGVLGLIIREAIHLVWCKLLPQIVVDSDAYYPFVFRSEGNGIPYAIVRATLGPSSSASRKEVSEEIPSADTCLGVHLAEHTPTPIRQ